MKSDPYLQFELCLLAHPGIEKDRVDLMIDRAINHFFWKISPEEAENLPEGIKYPGDFKPKTQYHRRAVLAAYKLGITLGSIDHHFEQVQKANTFIESFAPSQDAYIRIKKDWAFEVRDGKGMSYREFAILCALYSAIGDNDCRRVTIEQIQQRAAGCRSKEVFTSAKHRGQIFTTKQVRTTVEKLLTRNFFSRCSPNRREVFYSHRLPQEKLEQLVLGKFQKRYRVQTLKKRDATLQAQVKALKGQKADNTPLTLGQEKGHYNKNPFDENAEDKNERETRVPTGLAFVDPLKNKEIKAAWTQYHEDFSVTPREARIRLTLIADALRSGSLDAAEIVDALETSSGDGKEMHIVNVCQGIDGY